MTTKEKAQRIRQKLKDAGYSSRKVSVKVRYGTTDSSISVKIKDQSIPIDDVKAIAKQHQKIDRCEYSGEILCGGNTYVFVDYAPSYELN